ncbi:MAG: hypothetical protein LC774_05140 [Acidobacteria bacterium]|nr:hypothetical protein [Acidobacteriota bacterium]
MTRRRRRDGARTASTAGGSFLSARCSRVSRLALALLAAAHALCATTVARAQTVAAKAPSGAGAVAGRVTTVFTPGKNVNVGAGETVEGVDLTLVRGGVITGRVTNSEGKPVVAEQVSVTEGEQDPRRRRSGWVMPYFEFETDDRGVYRVYGVPAGRYVVSVGQEMDNNTVRVGGGARTYMRTYHPSATDPAQAKVVEVSAGSEAANVDIVIAEAPKTYAARGKIVDEAGKPVAGVTYWWGPMNGDQKTVGAAGSEGVPTNAEGEFVVTRLLPGRYAVYAADAGGGRDAIPLGNNYSDVALFEVADADVSGLVVKIHPGASVSGTVVLEGSTDRATFEKLSGLLISTEVRPATGEESPAPIHKDGRIGADGRFRVEGLRPGRVRINIWNRGLHSPFTLLAVQRGVVDVSGAGFDLSPGEQVADVRLRVGYGAGVLRGQIEIREGAQPAALPAGATLGVYARRAGSAGTIGAIPVEVDSRGRFLLEGLMGGEYELSVAGWLPASSANPQGRRLATFRQKINVSDTGETNVTIIYDLSRPPEGNP